MTRVAGFCARLLAVTGAGSLVRMLRLWRGVLTLTYHRIGEGGRSPFDRGVWSASPVAFDAQLRFLTRHLELIGPDQLADVLRKPRGRYALITFDDGYLDNYETAFPILRSRGVGAVFFLTTGFLDQPRLAWWDEIAWMVRRSPRTVIPASPWLSAPVVFDEPHRERAVRALLRRYKLLPGDATGPYLDFLAEASGSGRPRDADVRRTWMTWDMVREMRAGGMWVGGHTANHPVLSRLSPPDQRREISGCGNRIRAELGEPMKYFSYPVGGRDSFNSHTRACLAEEGVQFAFSYYGGIQPLRAWDPYDVPRVAVDYDLHPSRFRAIVTLPHLFARSKPVISTGSLAQDSGRSSPDVPGLEALREHLPGRKT